MGRLLHCMNAACNAQSKRICSLASCPPAGVRRHRTGTIQVALLVTPRGGVSMTFPGIQYEHRLSVYGPAGTATGRCSDPGLWRTCSDGFIARHSVSTKTETSLRWTTVQRDDCLHRHHLRLDACIEINHDP